MATATHTERHKDPTTLYNDIFDVSTDYMGGKTASFAKAVYVLGCDVPRELGYSYNPIIRNWANLIKLGHAPAELVKYAAEFQGKFTQYLKDPKDALQLAKALRSGNSMIPHVADSIELWTKIGTPISKEAMACVKGISGASLCIGMGLNACESINKIAKAEHHKAVTPAERQKAAAKVGMALINLIKEVSYVAIGVFLVLSSFFGFLVSSFVMTMLSASTVVFSALAYYCEHWDAKRKLHSHA